MLIAISQITEIISGVIFVFRGFSSFGGKFFIYSLLIAPDFIPYFGDSAILAI